MVYNYESVWLHLYAAFMLRLTQPDGPAADSPRSVPAEYRYTDCPITKRGPRPGSAWPPRRVSPVGTSERVSSMSSSFLPKRFDGISSRI